MAVAERCRANLEQADRAWARHPSVTKAWISTGLRQLQQDRDWHFGTANFLARARLLLVLCRVCTPEEMRTLMLSSLPGGTYAGLTATLPDLASAPAGVCTAVMYFYIGHDLLYWLRVFFKDRPWYEINEDEFNKAMDACLPTELLCVSLGT